MVDPAGLVGMALLVSGWAWLVLELVAWLNRRTSRQVERQRSAESRRLLRELDARDRREGR